MKLKTTTFKSKSEEMNSSKYFADLDKKIVGEITKFIAESSYNHPINCYKSLRKYENIHFQHEYGKVSHLFCV